MNCFIINITKKKTPHDIFAVKSLVTERANKRALLMWKKFLSLFFRPPQIERPKLKISETRKKSYQQDAVETVLTSWKAQKLSLLFILDRNRKQNGFH